jgi:hypothetical protein
MAQLGKLAPRQSKPARRSMLLQSIPWAIIGISSQRRSRGPVFPRFSSRQPPPENETVALEGATQILRTRMVVRSPLVFQAAPLLNERVCDPLHDLRDISRVI